MLTDVLSCPAARRTARVCPQAHARLPALQAGQQPVRRRARRSGQDWQGVREGREMPHAAHRACSAMRHAYMGRDECLVLTNFANRVRLCQTCMDLGVQPIAADPVLIHGLMIQIRPCSMSQRPRHSLKTLVKP